MARKTCFSILIFLLIVTLTPAYSKSMVTLAILPFETHSEKDISYIQSGVLDMLYSRLFWKDHVILINKNDVQKKLAGTKHLSEQELVLKLGDNAWTNYVLTGSITEFADAFSLDVKIYDIENRSYLTFYDQAAKIDQVIQKVDVISAKINKKAFDRTTASFEKFKKQELTSDEELKRMNPEKLMPYRGNMNQEKKKPWWKFW